MNKLIKILISPLLLGISVSANALLFDFSTVADGDYNTGDPVLAFTDSGITYTLSAPSTSGFFRFGSGQLLFGTPPPATGYNLTSFHLVVTGGDGLLFGYETGSETITGDTFNITGSNTSNSYDNLDGSTASNSVLFPTELTLLENQTYTFSYDLTANLPNNSGVTGFTALTVADATNVVPVPAAVWLFGSALMGLVGIRRRRKN